MKKSNVNALLTAFAALFLSFAITGTATADRYPAKPIHLVVPFKAGGGTDSIARGFAKSFEEAAGVPVVVDNVTGAGGAKGILHTLKSDPDGYTVLLDGSADITAPLTFQTLPFTLDDLVYIGAFFTSPTYVLSHKDRDLESLGQLLDKARKNPGQVTVGTAGPAGAQMIMASAIRGITGVEYRIIPYSGGADLKKALAGNQVDAGIIHAPVMIDAVKAGEVKVIGTGLPLTRITYDPIRQTPTLKEAGIDLEIGITRGLFLPKGAPPEVVSKLRQITKQAAASESFRRFGEGWGFPPIWMDHNELEQLLRSELSTYKRIKAEFID